MPSRPITLLHISDPQFGKNHRFAQQDLSGWDAPFDTLLARLQEDLKKLQEDHDLKPDLLVVTGDLAEWGRKSEFEDALGFIQGLCTFLDLPPRRVAIIPGNHDINRKLCESYFVECEGEELEPAFPFWPKWRHYAWFFQEFYRNTPGAEFTEELPWSFFEMPDLKVVVAGLNSTMQESHREEDHYGRVGEKQFQWFRAKLEAYRQMGWLRIGAIHHNFRRGATSDDENLWDPGDLQRVLGNFLNLLLHGHTHEGKLDWIHPGLPILATGSTALKADQRPPEVPNQYQIIRLWPDRICRWTRGFAPDRKTWIGDTRASEDGSRWWDEQKVAFIGIRGTFPEQGKEQPQESDSDLDSNFVYEFGHKRHPERADDFLSRVQTVCSLREPDSHLERIPGTGAWGDYLRVCRRAGGIATIFPVGAFEQNLSPAMFQLFLSEVDERYRRTDPQLVSVLVYGGERVSEELSQIAKAKRVHLQSFVEYQGLIDFRSYLARQTERLSLDTVYPPRLYVPQRMRYQVSREEFFTNNALDLVQEWVGATFGRFVVLLGDFGTGKTFLLHELARRMGMEEGGLIPILLQMRSLEKGRSLDALLAQHFAQEGVEDFSPSRFRYMLEQGRVALLFDGFDELALRVTFDRATEHFDTLLQAAAGAAKVVVTSRRQHFLSDYQVKTVLAERAETIRGHRIAILQPFNRSQIQAFLVNFCGDAASAEKRMQLIDHVEDLLGLSHNPRLLGFIAELPEEQLLEAKGGKGEITAARLYELLLRRWLVGEFERVHPRGAPPGLSVEDRWRGITALALLLWEKTESSAGLTELTERAARVIAALQKIPLDPAIAAFQLGSGTLLVRDEDGNFSFLHQSILEWLVSHNAAKELKKGKDPDALSSRQISPLMADFLSSLAGEELIFDWARRTLVGNATEAAKTNALLVLQRLKKEAQTTADLSDQDLRGEDLSYQDLTGADLTRADLSGARLIGTRLEAARLANARLVGANLSGALLSGADLSGADLSGARLLGADLRGTRMDGTILRRAKLLAIDQNSDTLENCDTFGAALNIPKSLNGNLVGSMASSQAVAWSPDGELLASADEDCVRLWESATGSEIRRFQEHDSLAWSVAFNPDGQILATASDDKSVRLWSVHTGAEIRRFVGCRKSVLSVAFSPDGNTIAGGSDDYTVRLWDVATGTETRRFLGHDNSVSSIAFSPDGRALASASFDKTIRLWEVTTGTEIRRFQGHKSPVRSIAFSPDGQALASASDDRTVRLWETATAFEVRCFQGHKSPLRSVAFSSDGQVLASASADSTVRLWDIASGTEVKRFQGHDNSVRSVTCSPNGQFLASASDDKTVRLWDCTTGVEIRRFQGRDNPIWSVAFSCDGQALASASEDKTVRLWNVAAGTVVQCLQEDESSVWSVAFSLDGLALASGSLDNTVRLWDVATGLVIQRLQGHEKPIWSIAFSPNGKTLISGSEDRTVRIWDVTAGAEIGCLRHDKLVSSVAFSPYEQSIASASDDKIVRLWDIVTGAEIRRFQGHENRVRGVAFSPDGQTIASASFDNTVRLWMVATGSEIQRFQGHESLVWSVAFSPDGQALASGSRDNTVRLWEIASGSEIQIFRGHGSLVRSIAFSPDGQTLASCSDDSTIRIWDVVTATCRAILSPLPEGWVAFSPDGRYKLGGIPAGGFWHVINLCRFEAGELDDWIPGLRLPDDASFFDLPPWTPEVRRPASLRRERS